MSILSATCNRELKELLVYYRYRHKDMELRDMNAKQLFCTAMQKTLFQLLTDHLNVVYQRDFFKEGRDPLHEAYSR